MTQPTECEMLGWGEEDVIEAADNVLAVIDAHEMLGEEFEKLDADERRVLYNQICMAIMAGFRGDIADLDFFADATELMNEGRR